MVEIAGAHEAQPWLVLIAAQLLGQFSTKYVESRLPAPQSYRAAIFHRPDVLRATLSAGPEKLRLRFKRIIKVKQIELHRVIVFPLAQTIHQAGEAPGRFPRR